MLCISGATMAFGLFWLAWILITLLHEGFGALGVTLVGAPSPGAKSRMLRPDPRRRRAFAWITGTVIKEEHDCGTSR